ncbi:type I restriction-modification system subunit M [Thiohalocapsa sp. ML1]|jgi:type I restriction enzyme M protein|uniref:type I restriction-modification system subunit M n=1 Tax=Thiohalocapsa sp. ML1 TaxID=1431688 RepID=UPI00073244EB|nr:type I restriction-modification system subunit M [Thiohalocapsa sp. ML1]
MRSAAGQAFYNASPFRLRDLQRRAARSGYDRTSRPISPAVDGRVRLSALDSHGMSTVFKELLRRFNKENNEEAVEHFTDGAPPA